MKPKEIYQHQDCKPNLDLERPALCMMMMCMMMCTTVKISVYVSSLVNSKNACSASLRTLHSWWKQIQYSIIADDVQGRDGIVDDSRF
jgi:hypothetical protein